MLSFKDFMLLEGSPLTKFKQKTDDGVHFASISAIRPHYDENMRGQVTNALQSQLDSLGYRYKRVGGMWQGAGEKSFLVYAKGSGEKHGQSLKDDMLELGQAYDQDAIMHHDGKSGNLIGTSERPDAWPKKDEHVPMERIQYNETKTDPKTGKVLRPQAETEFRPVNPNKDQRSGKTGKSSARIMARLKGASDEDTYF